MADIDSLFKKPSLPASTAKKRKHEGPSIDPVAVYKSAKLENGSNGKARGATVEDEDDKTTEMASPTDFAEDEDDEGRFFGGGVTASQSAILDFIDEKDKDNTAAEERIDKPWLRRTALDFEKKINKNAEMRGKFEDEPHKFMESEADLDQAIRSLSILSEHPELFTEFAKTGTLGSLVGLLAHENTDIAIEVVEVLSELTDDEVDAEPEQWNALVKGMEQAQILEMLASNLTRFNEGNETDRSGVYHTLSVFENLVSQQTISEKLVKETEILSWLLQRIQARESPISQNKQYSAELLAILLQSSSKNRAQFIKLDGVDLLLQLLAPYRKRDPVKGGDEEELVENLFDSLTCVVDDADGKDKFVESEGVELSLIMLREGKMSKVRALRLLDHAVSGQHGALVCERVIESAGLKTLFGMFMKKPDAHSVEHLLGIFAALLRLLPADSAPRIRTLAKFVEKEYEKIVKLMKLREDYARRLGQVDRAILKQRNSLPEDEISDKAEEWFSRRLDAGLFCLQMIDVILAWLCAEDDGAKARVVSLLKKKGESLDSVKKTLNEQLEAMDDTEDSEQQNHKDMLQTLVSCL